MNHRGAPEPAIGWLGTGLMVFKPVDVTLNLVTMEDWSTKWVPVPSKCNSHTVYVITNSKSSLPRSSSREDQT